MSIAINDFGIAVTAEQVIVPVSLRRRHIASLDGLRGLAILMVIACHFFGFEKRNIWWLDLIFRQIGCGWWGVDLFFVLSGFLITGILLDSKGQPSYFRNFYARRTLRIFPLYFGCLAAIFLVVPLFDREIPAAYNSPAWFWLYGTNILISIKNSAMVGTPVFPLAHFWSLAVEEHFYLAWPVIVLCLSRRQLVAVCAISIPLILMSRCLWIATRGDSLTPYVLTPFRADTLMFGGLAATLMRSNRWAPRLTKWAMPCFLVCASFVILLSFVKRWDIASGFGPRWGFTLLGAMFTSLLIATVASSSASGVGWFFSASWLRFLGRYSYGIYVYHALIMGVWWHLKLDQYPAAIVHSSTGGMLVSRMIESVICIGIAVASYRLFEYPFLQLKRFF